jgi:hypothetical protein
MITSFGGNDYRPVTNGFQSLTEYLRGHIGFWGYFSGTTDSNGYLTVTHNCGFEPDAVMVTQSENGTSHNQLGPHYVEELTSEILTIGFAARSGNASAGHTHSGWYLILPKVKER